MATTRQRQRRQARPGGRTIPRTAERDSSLATLVDSEPEERAAVAEPEVVLGVDLDEDLPDEDVDDFDDQELEDYDPEYGAIRATPWIIAITGAIGFIAAFVLMVERLILISNPDYSPTCSISEAVSCGTVMTSDAGAVFGFPNPLLGIAGFAILTTSGVAMLAGGKLRPWYWAGLQIGAGLAIVFIHWLMFQSIVVIQALCPYCMVVWAVTITAFWAITVRNLFAWRAARGNPRPTATALISYAPVWLTVWLASVAAVVVMFVLNN